VNIFEGTFLPLILVNLPTTLNYKLRLQSIKSVAKLGRTGTPLGLPRPMPLLLGPLPQNPLRRLSIYPSSIPTLPHLPVG
jgi:hypothetical protein